MAQSDALPVSPASTAPLPQRPAGDVLWAHATSDTRAAALMQIATRLRVQRPNLSLLLTLPAGLAPPENRRTFIAIRRLPQDTPSEITAFLTEWAPDLCLWTGGYLDHALLQTAAKRKIPLFLIDADESGFSVPRWRLLTDPSKNTLRQFRKILASTANAAKLLMKRGVPAADITITGPLIEGSTALPYNEAARDLMARTLEGRPLWLAAMAQPDEVGMIAAAHRMALRSAHRRLLILVPDDVAQGDPITASLRAQGWRVAQWSEDQHPDESTQILVADTRGEMGLWYRLCPITFMASSLLPDHGGQDPFEPAGLGSAILHGPHTPRYGAIYTRLQSTGAARQVRDADSLAAAVTLLTAPDQAAAMAHAAWEATTAGAEVTDAVTDLILDTLDRKAAL